MNSARRKNGGNRRRLKNGQWPMYLLIVAVGLVVTGIVGYGLFIGLQMHEVYGPLVAEVMGIKLEVATAHLRLHDQSLDAANNADAKQIWGHFDKADRYIQTMLNGGASIKGRMAPVERGALRQKLMELKETLKTLESNAREEFQKVKSGESARAIDHRFNTNFLNFLQQANDMHGEVHKLVVDDMRDFRSAQTVLVVICLLLFFSIGMAFHRFNRRLAKDFMNLQEMQKSLETEITERKRAEESLRDSHNVLEHKVKERTYKLNEANEKLTKEIQEREKYEEKLRESQKQLKDLSSRLLEAEEGLRKEIAKNLHDSLGQMLSAVKYSVENAFSQTTICRETNEQSLAKIVPMIQTAMEEVRRISMELRPSILDDLGILATIGWFCREFESVYSTIAVEKEIDIEEYDLPENMKIVVYRILQEAMNNVAKHSQAESVRISLKNVDGAIVLSIADDGQGFDPQIMQSKAAAMKGLGLASMRERAEFSGGVFSVASAPGMGTTIEASWSEEAIERFMPTGSEQ